MNRIKISIAVLGTALALSSCGKEYRCVCEWRDMNNAISNPPGYTIKAGNRTKAEQKCDNKEDSKFDCSLLN